MVDSVLVDIFLAEMHQMGTAPDRGAGFVLAAAVPSDLEAVLARLSIRGRTAFPGLQVPDVEFARLLARCGFKATLPVRQLDQLAVEDLYLACACLLNAAGAAKAFDDRCRAPLQAAISRLVRSPAHMEEVEQRVRHLLLVGTDQAPPKLASYMGRGALGKWVGVVAQRLALMMIRADKTEARMRDAAAAEAFGAQSDPELAFIKEQYRAPFRAALEEGLAALPDRERLVMRLNLVTGMSADGIAKIYGVNQSTVSRWLTRAREAVAAAAHESLRIRFGIAPDEVESLAGLMASQLDLSVSRILRGA